MVKYNVISGDKNIYIYGLNCGITIIINLLTSFAISIMTYKVSIFIIFMLTFIPLRSFSGGIHSSSNKMCYILSNFIIFLMLETQSFLSKNIFPYIFLTIFSCAFLVYINPSSSKVRILDNEETIFFNKMKRIIIGAIGFLVFILILVKKKSYATTAMSSINLTSVLVFLECVNIYTKKIIKGCVKDS